MQVELAISLCRHFDALLRKETQCEYIVSEGVYLMRLWLCDM